MPLSPLGKLLIGAGLVLVALGILVSIGGHLGLGRLPGDIHFRRGNLDVYFPLATSVLLSVLLSLIFWLFRR